MRMLLLFEYILLLVLSRKPWLYAAFMAPLLMEAFLKQNLDNLFFAE